MGDSLISENKWEISENRSRTGNEFFLQSFQRQTVNRIRPTNLSLESSSQLLRPTDDR